MACQSKLAGVAIAAAACAGAAAGLYLLWKRAQAARAKARAWGYGTGPLYNIKVAEVPRLPEDPEAQALHLDHHTSTLTVGYSDPEATRRGSNDNAVVRGLQWARWDYLHSSPENLQNYINALRLCGYPDCEIQALCDGVCPLGAKASVHAELVQSLRELGKALEQELGWRKVYFVQTGSNVAGYSSNPLKGHADRPSKIAHPDKSDMDFVVVGQGVGEWCAAFARRNTGEGAVPLFLFPTTETRDLSGTRYYLRDTSVVSKRLKQWEEYWGERLAGGVQVTFSATPSPVIPPWERCIGYLEDRLNVLLSQ